MEIRIFVFDSITEPDETVLRRDRFPPRSTFPSPEGRTMLTKLTRTAAPAALATTTALVFMGCTTEEAPASPSDEAAQQDPASHEEEFQQLEKKYDARLGVYAVDTGSDHELAHRADERFAYTSLFKPLACGALMERRSLSELEEEVVTYDTDDLVEYSPVTKKHVDDGMTLLEVCDAAMRYSDNTAGNLLFEEFGGPGGLQEALEDIGDDTTRMERLETELNEAVPGETRDTSTPEAMTANLREYVLGDTLNEDKRDVLSEKMRNNTTGDDLIRAGVPDGWEVGDKSGAGGYGTRNDIGLLWPPEGDPIVLAVMSSKDEEDAEYDDALVADAAEVVVDALG